MPPLPKLPTLKPPSHIFTFPLLNFLNPLADLCDLGVSNRVMRDVVGQQPFDMSFRSLAHA